MLPLDVKYALEKYHQIRKAYQIAQDKITEVNTKRFKAGSSMPKMPESNPESKSMTIIRNMEKHDKAVEDLLTKKYYIGIQEEFIASIPEKYRGMVEDKYINKLPCSQMEKKYGYDRTQMFRIINRLIDLYVENT